MQSQRLLVHFRRLAAERIHACGGLEVAQIQLAVPAPCIELRQLGLTEVSRAEHRGGLYLVAHPGFAQHPLLWHVSVLLRCHPLRARQTRLEHRTYRAANRA